MLTEKLLISISKEDRENLERLASINTSGNMTGLVRSLIKRAALMPEEFGLLNPDFSPALTVAQK